MRIAHRVCKRTVPGSNRTLDDQQRLVVSAQIRQRLRKIIQRHYKLRIARDGVALLIAGSIGHLFMTWLQSRAARVNAAVLFIALLLFGWLWGIWGLLLGAPLVAIIKVICDRVDSLKPVGELLGR